MRHGVIHELEITRLLSIDEKPHIVPSLFLTLRYETSLLMDPLFRCCLHINGVELPL